MLSRDDLISFLVQHTGTGGVSGTMPFPSPVKRERGEGKEIISGVECTLGLRHGVKGVVAVR